MPSLPVVSPRAASSLPKAGLLVVPPKSRNSRLPVSGLLCGRRLFPFQGCPLLSQTKCPSEQVAIRVAVVESVRKMLLQRLFFRIATLNVNQFSSAYAGGPIHQVNSNGLSYQ